MLCQEFASQASDDQIDFFRPLQTLANEYISEKSIKNAFSIVFTLICSTAVYSRNQSEILAKLTSQETSKKIIDLVTQLKEKIDEDENRSYIPSSTTDNIYQKRINTLYTEWAMLDKKIKTIAEMFVKQKNEFHSMKNLSHAVENKVYWNNIKEDINTVLALVTVMAMIYLHINVFSKY